jgi:integrase/recombinase XerD
VVSQEGSTPAIGDHQACTLLAAPDGSTLKGLRDRAETVKHSYCSGL